MARYAPLHADASVCEADSARSRIRVGVDIGGTFTDIVFLDTDGRIQTKKVPSSVDNYARAIVEGMRELLGDPAVRQARTIVDHVHDLMTTADVAGRDVAEIVHGTTVGPNAILERRGRQT